MTNPLDPPPKKNPQVRTYSPSLPPAQRSRAALGLSAAAAEGLFKLQRCANCETWQYPARDACVNCLCPALLWQEINPAGELVAETTVQTSTQVYFRERTPWRMGTVKLDAGPVILCHVHGDVAAGARVALINRLDRAGQGVLLALPEKNTPHFEDDAQLRELTCHPKHRRILITDARAFAVAEIVQALLSAGAQTIFVGQSESWRSSPEIDALRNYERTEIVPLDVTDTRSVQELAAEIGAKTDILINTACFVRPGGVLSRGDTQFALEEIQVNYLGMMRLAQAFGPVMCARSADGVNSATAWVNILSAYALCNDPGYGCFSASHAAAHSLSQSLRAEFKRNGIRVSNLFTGATEDVWYQPLPPPKVSAAVLAKHLVNGLQEGLEDIYCGDVAKDLIERARAGYKVLELEMTAGNFGQ